MDEGLGNGRGGEGLSGSSLCHIEGVGGGGCGVAVAIFGAGGAVAGLLTCAGYFVGVEVFAEVPAGGDGDAFVVEAVLEAGEGLALPGGGGDLGNDFPAVFAAQALG